MFTTGLAFLLLSDVAVQQSKVFFFYQIFCFMDKYSFLERSGLQAGYFNTLTLLLQSQAVANHTVCGLALFY